MKTNKIYIIGAITLILGLLLFSIGFWVAGFNINNLNTEGTYEEKTFESTKEINTIEISDSNTDVEFTASADNKLHMTYYENDKIYYEISENNGTFSAVKKSSRKWYDNFFNINFEKRTLSVSVPADFTGNISVKTSNNDIIVTDLNASEMLLRTSNNRIEIDNVKVGGLLDVNTSNGGIILSDSAITGDVVCRTSNGKIEFDKVGCANAEADSSNGSIIITSVNSSGKIDAQTSNGKIEIGDIKFVTELSLITSNSSVKGEITGKLADYTVSSKTSNAKNNLPENMKSGDKKITVNTSNGAIEIGFTED